MGDASNFFQGLDSASKTPATTGYMPMAPLPLQIFTVAVTGPGISFEIQVSKKIAIETVEYATEAVKDELADQEEEGKS